MSIGTTFISLLSCRLLSTDSLSGSSNVEITQPTNGRTQTGSEMQIDDDLMLDDLLDGVTETHPVILEDRFGSFVAGPTPVPHCHHPSQES